MSVATYIDHVKGDLAALGLSDYRIEPLNGRRNRILVEHEGHTLAVSFAARAPHRGTAVASKLRLALRELAEVAA